MALISSRVEQEKEKLKIEIDADIFSELTAYMKWADLDNISHCIEDSLAFVFKSDKEWKKFQKGKLSLKA